MIGTADFIGDARDRWVGDFVERPTEALADLISGYALAYPLHRLDAPEVAKSIFGGLEESSPARKLLAPALIAWLERARRESIPNSRPKLQRFIREICDAFEIVALLDVTDAAVELRHRFDTFNDWVSRLVRSTARDARAEYWRMLALMQPSVEARPEVATSADEAGLMPFWLLVCREAGNRLPAHYLQIGLLGLRRTTKRAGGSEVPWLSGLAQWALSRDPPDNVFKAEWLALKQHYPRGPDRWRRLVYQLLSTSLYADAGVNPPAWWSVDGDFAPLVKGTYQRPAERLRSPGPADTQTVVELISTGTGDIEAAVHLLMHRHREFVRVTGDARYFVRAIHVVGQTLIQKPGANLRGHAQMARTLAREGIEWVPSDRYLWSLWRDALAAEGELEAAELIGWEYVRRDPYPDAYSQLATLLSVELHRPAEAQALLIEALDRFPEDLILLTHLAKFFARSPAGAPRAEELLREIILGDPDSVVPRMQLFSLLVREGNRDREAEEFMRETIAQFPKSEEQPYLQLAELLVRGGRAAEAEDTLRRALAVFPDSPQIHRALAALLVRGPGRDKEAARAVDAMVDAVPSPVALQIIEELIDAGGAGTAEKVSLLKNAAQSAHERVKREVRAVDTRKQSKSKGAAVPPGEPAGSVRPLRVLPDEPGPTKSAEAGRASTPDPSTGDREPAESSDGPETPAVPEPQTAPEKPEVAETAQVAHHADRAYVEMLRRGGLRRIRSGLHHPDFRRRKAVLEELRRTFAEDPTFAYAEILAARHRLWISEADALPRFAAAFEEALALEDRARLEELARIQPRLKALTLVARAVLGDAEAAAEVDAWLRASHPTAEGPGVRVLRQRLTPALVLIDGGLSPGRVFVQHRRLITETLYDANEAEIGDLLLAA